MRVCFILLCIGLLFTGAQASNNVEIHFNYPADTIFIGTNNTMEIWIENDFQLGFFSMALELTSDITQIEWNSEYGSGGIQAVNDAVNAFSNFVLNPTFMSGSDVPDTIRLAVLTLAGSANGLPANSARACFAMQFYIPETEVPGSLTVANIFGLESCEWLFINEDTEVTPDFDGCANLNPYTPNCGGLTFSVISPPVPLADFSFMPESGDYPLEVSFFDLSSNFPTGWRWLFGDGGSSTEQNPTHTYNIAGTFFPTLIVSNNSGADTLISTTAITVTTPEIPEGINLTCNEVQEIYSGTTVTVDFLVENNTDYPGDFDFTVNDSLGWFISPTFYQFHLDSYAASNIEVDVLVPDELALGIQNKITGTVTLQSDPQVTDAAVCRLITSEGLCGDVNLDGKINVSDAVYLINFVFSNGPAPCETGK